ncbi:hypothetical protein ACW4YW_15230 [Methylobacillus pratensis]
MIERPIIFSAPMVQAILAGNKSQTRRVIKANFHEIAERDDGKPWPWRENLDLAEDYWYPCPYGKIGDHLWVRETFQGPMLDEEQREQFRQDGSEAFQKPEFCAYRATDTLDAIDDDRNELGWKPSIHMPRWASRIQLEITDIRVERLQDCSEEDAKAEGADCLVWSGIPGTAADLIDWPLREVGNPYRNGYALLWEAINGDGTWKANPWVWVIEFKRVYRHNNAT